MRIDSEVKLDYNNVLIRPKRSTLTSRKEVDLTRRFTYRNYSADFPDNVSDVHYEGVPIMAANMDGVGTFDMADKLAEGGLFTCLVKTYTVNELVSYFDNDMQERTECVAMSIGITDADEMKFRNVYEQVGTLLKYVCIDVANGYTERFVEFVKLFRQNYPRIVIIAGNVVTADQTQELILNGADIVKVGIGPGSVCTTRIKTGVGYPQLSAVIECADAAHGLGGHIIADGGCTTAGDVVKAFAAGADFVMLGGMLAGHVEGGGEVINKYYETNEVVYEVGDHLDNRTRKVEVKKFVKFYGMSSDAANIKHFGGLKDYRASEGREVLVPYRGTVASTAQDILGGMRSACTYVGADKLKRLSKCTTFILCNDTHNRVYEAKNV
jgi:GMP reductase